VRVVTLVTNARVDLVAEGYDVALRAGSMPDSSLIAKMLGDTCLLLVASPSYLDRRGRPTTLDDLASHDCLLLGERDSEQWRVTGPRGRVSVKVSGRICANDLAFLLSMAERGAGICRMPRSLARARIEAKIVEHVLPDYIGAFGKLYVAYPSTTHVSTKVQRFVELCVEKASNVI
jgi:DNA-binding transcriptional LysR family regulator